MPASETHTDSDPDPHARPVRALLCVDGSADAAAAVSAAAGILRGGPVVVLTVCEPVRAWEPWDPATVLTAPVGRLVARAVNLEGVLTEAAEATAHDGVELARSAGLDASPLVRHGHAGPTICRVANALAAETIILGAHGLGRVRATLLGSVAAHVVNHADRPVLVVPAPR